MAGGYVADSYEVELLDGGEHTGFRVQRGSSSYVYVQVTQGSGKVIVDQAVYRILCMAFGGIDGSCRRTT